MTIYTSDGETFDGPVEQALGNPVTPNEVVSEEFKQLKRPLKEPKTSSSMHPEIDLNQGDWESRMITDFPPESYIHPDIPNSVIMKDIKQGIEQRRIEDRDNDIFGLSPQNRGIPVIPGQENWTGSKDRGLPVVYSEADQRQQASEVAAERMQRSVRSEKPYPTSPELREGIEAISPAIAAASALGRGDYGEAAKNAFLSALPFGAGAAGKAIASPAGRAAAAGALGGSAFFGDPSTGGPKLSPAAQERLRVLQETSRIKQEERTADSLRKKEEADAASAREAQAARDKANTEAELQKELARINSENEIAHLKIEKDRADQERAATEATLKANIEANKKQAERPFRERHPDAALNMTLGGLAVAAVIPGASQGFRTWAFNRYLKEWKDLDAVATHMLQHGTPQQQALAVNRLTAAQAELANRQANLYEMPYWQKYGAPGLAMESSMVPTEIDFTQPEGSTAKESAKETFTNPMTAAQLGLLGIGGVLGAKGGQAAVGGSLPTRSIPTGTAGTVKTFEQMEKARKAAEKSAKSAATRAANKKKKD